ncbi:MAG: YdcH family protein [Roseobacter sp.]
MSVTAHVDQLKKKHQSLSEAVEAAQRSPGTDDLAISSLKKEKLRLKEEITRLSS